MTNSNPANRSVPPPIPPTPVTPPPIAQSALNMQTRLNAQPSLEFQLPPVTKIVAESNSTGHNEGHVRQARKLPSRQPCVGEQHTSKQQGQHAQDPRSIVAPNASLQDAGTARQSLHTLLVRQNTQQDSQRELAAVHRDHASIHDADTVVQNQIGERTMADSRAADVLAIKADIESDDASSVVIPMRRWKIYRDNFVALFCNWGWKNQPGWMTSMIVHAVAMIILALITIPLNRPGAITLEFSTANLPGKLDAYEIEMPVESEPFQEEFELTTTPSSIDEPLDKFDPAELAISLQPDVNAVASLVADTPKFPSVAGQVGTPGGVAGRSQRRAGAIQFGASPESEEAVDRALVWLAAHQMPNGSWRFDIRNCPGCDGKCRHSGTGTRAVNGATALALLPFLGAGQTHEKGYHRNTVRKGIQFLIKNQSNDGGYYEPDGTMYSHGLAALALCEALAMSDSEWSTGKGKLNRKIRLAAKRATQFTIKAQHAGGGWRYRPGQPGDTSVVGWKAMALQSAKMAQISVPKKTFSRISKFLDSVAGDEYGSTYGYTRPGSRPGTTAIGLLCRMYLGWNRNHHAIATGAQYLDENGPSSNNAYYNYYATQVMHHYQGPLWETWNGTLRDYLVETQGRRGHEHGSWYFDGDHGSTVGGRLYITAINTMTLEVYYRHMPIYSKEAVPQAVRLGQR